MQSIVAHLELPQPRPYLRLHFFEEYDVPLHFMSKTEKDGKLVEKIESVYLKPTEYSPLK